MIITENSVTDTSVFCALSAELLFNQLKHRLTLMYWDLPCVGRFTSVLFQFTLCSWLDTWVHQKTQWHGKPGAMQVWSHLFHEWLLCALCMMGTWRGHDTYTMHSVGRRAGPVKDMRSSDLQLVNLVNLVMCHHVTGRWQPCFVFVFLKNWFSCTEAHSPKHAVAPNKNNLAHWNHSNQPLKSLRAVNDCSQGGYQRTGRWLKHELLYYHHGYRRPYPHALWSWSPWVCEQGSALLSLVLSLQ